MSTAVLAVPINWVHVTALLATLGVPVNDIALLVIEPWGITVTAYVRDADGNRHIGPDGQAATVTSHHPREAFSWQHREDASL